MKMKAACQATGLTERAVRLYIHRGLIRPARRNGILTFTDADIARLRDIASLRGCDFSLEQIARITLAPGDIAAVIRERTDEARARHARARDILCALEALHVGENADLQDVAMRLRQSGAAVRPPDFARLDGIDGSTRARLGEEAAQALSSARRREGIRRRVLPVFLCALALCAAAAIYLFIPRLSGVVSLSGGAPVLTKREGLTLSLTLTEKDARLGDLLAFDVRLNAGCADMMRSAMLRAGQDAQGYLPVGEPLRGAPKVMLRVSNWDIVCLGVSPFANSRDQAWRARVVRALFADAGRLYDAAELWLYETPNAAPLLDAPIAGGDEMPDVYLNITPEYVREHLKDIMRADVKRYIL